MVCLGQIKDSTEVGFPVKDGRIVYESIGDAKGVKKEAIYASAKKWIVDSFKSSKTVIQTEDKEDGQLIGSALSLVSIKNNSWLVPTYELNLDYTIQINCKDGKYRIRFYDIKASNSLLSNATKVPLENFGKTPNGKELKDKQKERIVAFREAINTEFTLLLNSFHNSVNQSSDDAF